MDFVLVSDGVIFYLLQVTSLLFILTPGRKRRRFFPLAASSVNEKRGQQPEDAQSNDEGEEISVPEPARIPVQQDPADDRHEHIGSEPDYRDDPRCRAGDGQRNAAFFAAREIDAP